MAYTFIRTRKSGRRYKYVQESYREGGKVKTRYLSCTPLDPPIPKRPRKGKIDWAGTVKGVVSMGVTAALGKLGPPGGLSHKNNRYRPVDPRTFEKMTDKERQMELLRARIAREDDERRAEARQYNTPAAKEWKIWFAEQERAELTASRERETKAFAEWQEHQKGYFKWDGTIYSNREDAQKALAGYVESLSRQAYYNHVYGPGPDDHALVTQEYTDSEKQERSEHAKAYQTSLHNLNADIAQATPSPDTAPDTAPDAGDSSAGEGQDGQGDGKGDGAP